MSVHFPAFHVMIKPHGAVCNLHCDYCFYRLKAELYPKKTLRMTLHTLETFIQQYIAGQKITGITFGWQGGEPTLMGLEFFEKIIQLQKRYCPTTMKLENTLQTNGTLLDDKWAQFLYDNHFLVGLSMDGPEEIHNLYRKDANGKGSFNHVLYAWNLLNRYHVDTNILCCVHNGNARKPSDVYHFFRDTLKAEFIQFIPIVEYTGKIDDPNSIKIHPESVKPQEYGSFLNSIFDEWVQKDVGKVFIQLFDTTLARWMNVAGGVCMFMPNCGNAVAMEFNGDVYSCDHYVFPEYKLGNIHQRSLPLLVNSKQQIQFGRNKSVQLPEYCKKCHYLFACNGECPKNRILFSPDHQVGLNYLCEGYKLFFSHIQPYMEKMAEFLRKKEPAAKIMEDFSKK